MREGAKFDPDTMRRLVVVRKHEDADDEPVAEVHFCIRCDILPHITGASA